MLQYPVLPADRWDAAAAAVQLREVLGSARTLAALCHENPDADTIGGAIAMALVARELGIESEVISVDRPAPVFDFLPMIADVRSAPTGPADVIVVCDAATLERVGRLAVEQADWFHAGRIVNIDHHITNTDFGAVNCVDPDAAATCQVIAELLPGLGIRPDRAIATALLAGIVRDSQGFADGSTSAKTLRLAADLIEAGGDLPDLQRRILGELPYPTMALWGKMLNSLDSALEGRVVVTTLLPWMLEETGTEQHDADGLAEFIARAKGADVAILLREVGPDETRVSVRVAGGVNAAEIVRAFGGGGHARRAGATINAPATVAARQVLSECERVLRDLASRRFPADVPIG
jgi:phosphoesterase RecJ-like protein